MKSTVLAVAVATTMMMFAQSAYARDHHHRQHHHDGHHHRLIAGLACVPSRNGDGLQAALSVGHRKQQRDCSHRQATPLPSKATRDIGAAVAGARPHGAAGRCGTSSARIRARHSISHATGRVGVGRERRE
jgi:hypothetical protein